MDFSIYNGELKDAENFLSRFGTEKEIFELILELSQLTKTIKSQFFMTDMDLLHLDLFLSIYGKALEKLDEKFGIDTSFERNNLPKVDGESPLASDESGDRKAFKVWFKEMGDQYKKDLFEKMICSACPYCKESRENSENFPCNIMSVSCSEPTYPWRCHLLDEDDDCFTREELLEIMKNEKGEDALNIFLEKEKILKEEYSKDLLQKYKNIVLQGGVMTCSVFRRDVKYLVENGSVAELQEIVGLMEKEKSELLIFIIDLFPKEE
jgi:hypothetical protein